MAEQTAISWADATFNPWIGCTKVSTGLRGACENCYAERDNKRRGWVSGWGPGVPRRRTSAATWNNPIKWDRQAAATERRPRVFCASLADVFDNEVPDAWRHELFALIRNTPNLRWMLLTKRIGNAPKMLPPDWASDYARGYAHVGLMATLATQEEWDRDIGKLLAVPAAWHGVSCEPLLGKIVIENEYPDWIITGGESGPGFRKTDPNWVRLLRDQCANRGIAFHHKQWGGARPKENGCELDGREHKAFPPTLQ
jgi:protein gp37